MSTRKPTYLAWKDNKVVPIYHSELYEGNSKAINYPTDTILIDMACFSKVNYPQLNSYNFGVYEINAFGIYTWRSRKPSEYPEFILALTLEGYL